MSEILRPIRLDELGEFSEVERSIIMPPIDARPTDSDMLTDIQAVMGLLDDLA